MDGREGVMAISVCEEGKRAMSAHLLRGRRHQRRRVQLRHAVHAVPILHASHLARQTSVSQSSFHAHANLQR